jgi:NTE family protein
MAPAIKNLVFEGTGVRNAIYAGGLLALEEAGLYQEIESVAGTSSGSIVAAMVAVGYSASEVTDAILDLDFSKLLDGSPLLGPLRVFTRFGWHKGDYFIGKMRAMIERKTGKGDITFADCRARGYKNLRIVGSSITRRAVRVFPDDSSLDMPLADAVRISMSIPLFFTSMRYQDEVYVDGGVMWNYPLGLFDEPGTANLETLGFHVENTPLVRSSGGMRTRTPHDYFAGLFGCLIRQQESDLVHRPLDRVRTVSVSDGGVLLTDFGIGRSEKLALVEAGRQATRAYLSQRDAAFALQESGVTAAAPPIAQEAASKASKTWKPEVLRGRPR